MVRVKVCGIANLDDALVAALAGADALGFNFWPGSSRYIEPRKAAEIIRHLPPLVTAVGLVVNETPAQVLRLAGKAGVRAVQLHGEESPQETAELAGSGLTVIKAFRVGKTFRPQKMRAYEAAAAFLLDAEVEGRRGGTGKPFDWRKARAAARFGRILLAGGLTPDNVAEAIAQARPFGVDVCSGVESRPGRKDHEKLRTFIAQAKGA